jgi:enoyl-CoA hydratase/carnithine racemase
VVPADQVAARARDMALALAAKPPAALRATKALMRGDQAAVEAAIAAEARLFGQRLASPELQDAVAAFFAKRKPDFSKFI